MKVYALAEIKRALQKIDVLPLIKEGFIAYSSGLTVVPPVGELLFDNPPGDVHIKYGYIKNDDYYVVKVASGFYGSSQNNIPPYQSGVMLLFDQKTGKEVGILVDECYLTNVRTAVAGAICADFFSPQKVNCIGIIGSGIQARMQLEYLTEIIDCKKVKVWSRSEKGIDSYINDMSSFGWNLEKAKSPDEIAATCDLIITATPSKTPLLKSEYLKKGAHINAIGSDSPKKNELDKNILKNSSLIVADSIEQCIERGEISHALSSGAIKKSDIYELGEILKKNIRLHCGENENSVADLTGVAVQDIQIAKAVFKECEK